MRFFKSVTMKTGANVAQMPKGLWRELVIRLTGTNTSGNTVSHADVSSIQITKNGSQVINVPGSWLLEMNKQRYGNVETTSVDNDAFALTFKIPFDLPGLENSFLVEPGDNVEVRVNEGSGVATEVSAGVCSFYAVAGRAPQNFIPKLIQVNNTAAAAVQLPEAISHPNVAEIWVNSGTAAYMTNVQVLKDDELLVSASYSALLADTALNENLGDGTAASWAHLKLGNGISDLISDQLTVECTHSQANTQAIIVLALDFAPEEYNRSTAAAKRVSETKKKLIENKRPVDVQQLQKIAMPPQKLETKFADNR